MSVRFDINQTIECSDSSNANSCRYSYFYKNPLNNNSMHDLSFPGGIIGPNMKITYNPRVRSLEFNSHPPLDIPSCDNGKLKLAIPLILFIILSVILAIYIIFIKIFQKI